MAEADYASIVSQVKSAEFDQEFDKRIHGMAELRNTATELDAATDCFDKAIRKLIKMKECLLSFENPCALHGKGVDAQTIRKLTYNNPTMKQ